MKLPSKGDEIIGGKSKPSASIFNDKSKTGRKCSICAGEHAPAVNRMIAENKSFRVISRQILGGEKHHDAVRRHAENCLKIDLQAVFGEKKLAEALDLHETLKTLLTESNKMASAISEWLTDPDNSDKFDISPRDDEMTVVYLDHNDLFMGEPKRKKASLRDLLALAHDKGFTAISVNSSAMDNRKLYLDSIKAFGEQLDRYVKYFPPKTEGEKRVFTTEEDAVAIARRLLVKYSLPEVIEALAQDERYGKIDIKRLLEAEDTQAVCGN